MIIFCAVFRPFFLFDSDKAATDRDNPFPPAVDQHQNYWCQDSDLRLFYGLLCIGAFSLFTRRVLEERSKSSMSACNFTFSPPSKVGLYGKMNKVSSSLIPLVERLTCTMFSDIFESITRSWHDLIDSLFRWIRLNLNTFFFF